MNFLREPKAALLAEKVVQGEGPYANPTLGLLNRAYFKLEQAQETLRIEDCQVRIAEAQQALRDLAAVLTKTPNLAGVTNG